VIARLGGERQGGEVILVRMARASMWPCGESVGVGLHGVHWSDDRAKRSQAGETRRARRL
jgi:hypothetical protein